MRRFYPGVLVVLFVLWSSGCANMEFRVVQPAQYAQRIAKEPVTIPYPPLEYRLSANRERLDVRIYNPTTQSAALLAQQSFVVDPDGESHPIRGGVVGPHSHIRLTLPPRPANVQAYGPLGGVYTPFWGVANPGWPYAGWGFYAPYSFYSYDVWSPYDWTWQRGEVRLQLGFESAGSNFQHQFVFLRQKVK